MLIAGSAAGLLGTNRWPASAGGAREFDDWRHPLPTGRTLLYSSPVAAKQAEPDHQNHEVSKKRNFEPTAAVAPDGWVMVPRVATEEMHVAACKVLARANGIDGTPQRMLDAMLAAAPTPPASTDRAMGAEGCVPLTDEALANLSAKWGCGPADEAWLALDVTGRYLMAFRAGFRSAERAHGITTPPSGATSAEDNA